MTNLGEHPIMDSFALAARSAKRKAMEATPSRNNSTPYQPAPRVSARGEALKKAVPPHLRYQDRTNIVATTEREDRESANHDEKYPRVSARIKALIDAVPPHLRKNCRKR